ncbi:hypothetical protein PYCC9005_004900 [Savitreella phatthalungensis]
MSSQDKREGKLLQPHLDPNYSARPETILPSDDPQRDSSLKLKGGDVHRDLYRIDARAAQAKHRRTRSDPQVPTEDTLTSSGSNTPARDGTPTITLPDPSTQRRPGGFRRAYLQQQNRQANHRRGYTLAALPGHASFVQFLDLYGSFAGEDLADTDDDDDDDDDENDGEADREEDGRDDDDREGQSQRRGERRPLLNQRRSTKKSSSKEEAGSTKTFFLLLKSFIGTGVLFLPKAFRNGGLIFSSAMLLFVSFITCVAFHLLLQCRRKHPGGYGDIGQAVAGPRMRNIILISVALSQVGFVCAGVIFTAENMRSFLDAVTGGGPPLSTNALIAIQIALLLPLALVRNISKLGSAALLADVFILAGLAYIWYYDTWKIVHQKGLQKGVVMFNPSDFALTIGSTIFTFEGIGLILPIQQSMKKPQHFSKLLYGVMALITVVFAAVGFLSYAAFGDTTKVEIIDNLPQTNKLVNAVQCLYSLAILVGTPVQLFPAVRILEGYVFGRRSGKRDTTTKWKKNGFRVLVTIIAGVIAAAGADDLDKFVALLGSIACVPLVYIYPAFLHYKAIASTRLVRLADLIFMIAGVAAALFTGTVTIQRWVTS